MSQYFTRKYGRISDSACNLSLPLRDWQGKRSDPPGPWDVNAKEWIPSFVGQGLFCSYGILSCSLQTVVAGRFKEFFGDRTSVPFFLQVSLFSKSLLLHWDLHGVCDHDTCACLIHERYKYISSLDVLKYVSFRWCLLCGKKTILGQDDIYRKEIREITGRLGFLRVVSPDYSQTHADQFEHFASTAIIH